jgi:hypothetical protein
VSVQLKGGSHAIVAWAVARVLMSTPSSMRRDVGASLFKPVAMCPNEVEDAVAEFNSSSNNIPFP